ncbi:PREDICTED: uncharacterized protein LOC104769197 [Camelina sativa]|uniref:Uncharacterized protein LOC104769197 n=1 Tax=Camelina sativa TaxID=90675 RepID=A0ABM0XVL5_CAMSA|nr:PREDICTED: uncharacterized protein LOC104769197 [Camelina sativa]
MMGYRLFSTNSQTHLPPYFIFGKPQSGDGGDIDYFDVSKSELRRSKKKVPWPLLEPRGIIGASRGLVAIVKKHWVSLQDLNLSPSRLNRRQRTQLPPFVPLRHCQTRIVTNMAISSSYTPMKDDYVVAVKFLGPQLSFCRPSRDNTHWTSIRIQDPSFFTSHVMFSERDQMFSLLSSGGDHMASWDFFKHRDIPKFRKLHFQNLPSSLGKTNNIELRDSCYRTEHLVESSAGESFLVIWYRSATYGTEEDMVDLETKGFRVFRVDEEGNATYTEDIGDLCIFLSKSEPFCVPASSFPGLERNFIYYLDVHESTQELERGGFSLCRADSAKNFSQLLHSCKVPYFFPPQPMQ